MDEIVFAVLDEGEILSEAMAILREWQFPVRIVRPEEVTPSTILLVDGSGVKRFPSRYIRVVPNAGRLMGARIVVVLRKPKRFFRENFKDALRGLVRAEGLSFPIPHAARREKPSKRLRGLPYSVAWCI